MEVLKLISRLDLGTSRTISIETFLSLSIDYRACGNQLEQMEQLNMDYMSVGWRSMRTGQRIHVDRTFQCYLYLIRGQYTLEIPVDLAQDV